MEPAALLSEFSTHPDACVVFKAHYTQLGNDVSALVRLAQYLPRTVRFLPFHPRIDPVIDIRHIFPALLAENDPAQPGHFDMSAADAKEMRQQVLLQLLMAAKDPSSSVAGRLKDLSSEKLLDLLLDQVATQMTRSEETMASLLPDEGPVLIIGRPELFYSYNDRKSQLRRILDSAGYPNRFEYVGGNSPLGGVSAILDRKLRRRWTREKPGETTHDGKPLEPPPDSREDERHRTDVGFLFRGRTPQRQLVTVATGATTLGTFAAVRLLMRSASDIDTAVRESDAARHPLPIDIGFQCAAAAIPNVLIPLQRGRDLVRTTILNLNDMTGYRWGRTARSMFQDLLQCWDGKPTKEPPQIEDRGANGELYMTWSWDRTPEEFAPQAAGPNGAGQKLVRVRIRSKRYCVADGIVMRPSSRLGTVLDGILCDIRADRQEWRHKLEVWQRSGAKLGSKTPILAAMKKDLAEALAPVLLLGPTGSGKQYVAEFIARAWNGRVLPQASIASHPEAQRLDKVDSLLEDYACKFMATSPDPVPNAERMLTLSPVSVPDTLLDRELFGASPGYATGTTSGPGYFALAGTGVLFLDELPELPLEQQARYLVALQRLQVQPLGVQGGSRCYLARVVAATNRATNAHELKQLVTDGDVREDLMGRFRRRYEIPGLSGRLMEIVPCMIEFVRRSLSLPHSPVFRISHQAFDALVTHHFSENMRELQSIVSQLPRENVVESFSSFFGQGDLSQCSVLLRHLRRFFPGADEPHEQDNSQPEQETRFYEFWIDGDAPPAPPANAAPEAPFHDSLTRYKHVIDPIHTRMPAVLALKKDAVRPGEEKGPAMRLLLALTGQCDAAQSIYDWTMKHKADLADNDNDLGELIAQVLNDEVRIAFHQLFQAIVECWTKEDKYSPLDESEVRGILATWKDWAQPDSPPWTWQECPLGGLPRPGNASRAKGLAEGLKDKLFVPWLQEYTKSRKPPLLHHSAATINSTVLLHILCGQPLNTR